MEAHTAAMDERKKQKQKRRVQFAGDDADDDDGGDAPRKRQPLLPEKDSKKKGKGKGKGELALSLVTADEEGGADDGGIVKSAEDVRAAASSRAQKRIQKKGFGKMDAAFGSVASVTSAEEDFQGEDDEKDAMEPFNLEKEREEGYYDAEGNYVEYRKDAELHDAWLDSVQVEPRYAAKAAEMAKAYAEAEKEGASDISRKELATIKRRIADILLPEETVLRGLKRLGGSGGASSGKAKRGGKVVMQGKGGVGGSKGGDATQGRQDAPSEEDKRKFEQLTDDAFKLMDSGETDVYSEKREVFLREAEGYEALERARRSNGASTSGTAGHRGTSEDEKPEDTLQKRKRSAEEAASMDMFGEDGEEEPPPVEQEKGETGKDRGSESKRHKNQERTEDSAAGATQQGNNGSGFNGYVYDDSSGYYYNSEVGYYYDPNSGLFCSATTGKWYSFDEGKNEYVEVPKSEAKQDS